jgi:hypothetical protein
MNRWIKSYFYSSAHISIVGAIFFIGTQASIHSTVWFQALMVMGAIFCVYNLMRITRVHDFEAIQNNSHLTWVSSHLTELIFAILGFVSLILCTMPLVHFNRTNGYLMILVVLYLFGRKVLFLKNSIIALCWGYVPFVFDKQFSFSLMCFYTLFFLWLSIWYDLKDPFENKLLNWVGTKKYFLILFLLMFAWAGYGCSVGLSPVLLFCVFLAGVVAAYCTYRFKSEVWYMALVDSFILFPIFFAH